MSGPVLVAAPQGLGQSLAAEAKYMARASGQPTLVILKALLA